MDYNYQQLSNLVKLLLDWDPECRLTGNACLSHPFFQKTESNWYVFTPIQQIHSMRDYDLRRAIIWSRV